MVFLGRAAVLRDKVTKRGLGGLMGLVRHNFGGQDPSEKAVWRTDPGNFSSGNFLFRILLIWKDKGTGDRPFSEGL